MPAGAIHFVTETGQSEIGVPGKKRLSKINSHVARFSHNRRKNNKNNNSTTLSRIVSRSAVMSHAELRNDVSLLMSITGVSAASRFCHRKSTNRRFTFVK